MKKVIANNPVRIAVLLWRLIIKARKKGINPVNARNTGNEKNEPKFVSIIDLPQNTTKVYFEFNNVPEGIYAIKCFQDLNNNNRIDMGLFGPKEPYGLYRVKKRFFGAPKFENLSFYLYKNISNIKLKLN